MALQFMLEVTADAAEKIVVGIDRYIGGRFLQHGTRNVLGTWASLTPSVDTVTNGNPALPGVTTGMMKLQLFFAESGHHGHGGGGGGHHQARAPQNIVMQLAPSFDVKGNNPPTVGEPGILLEAIGSVSAASQQFAATRDEPARLEATKNLKEFELTIG